MIPFSESGTSKTKHAASCPFGLPALTRQGVLGMNSRASMTSFIATKNLSRFSPVSALETWPTTRQTMASQPSNGCPFAAVSEEGWLTTFLALIPSGCDFRRGETAEMAGTFPIFLPTVALIYLCLSRSKNGCTKQIATLTVSLRVLSLGAAVCQLYNSSGREYSAYGVRCQPISCGYFYLNG